MKKYILTLAVAALSLAVVSCNKAKDKVAQKWKIVKMTDFEKRLTDLETTAGLQKVDSLKSKILDKKAAEQMMYDQVKASVMEFKKDGTYSISGAMAQSGTWEVDKDGKTLTTTQSGKSAETVNIKELTKEKIVYDAAGVEVVMEVVK